jgi:hypothetical protein
MADESKAYIGIANRVLKKKYIRTQQVKGKYESPGSIFTAAAYFLGIFLECKYE